MNPSNRNNRFVERYRISRSPPKTQHLKPCSSFYSHFTRKTCGFTTRLNNCNSVSRRDANRSKGWPTFPNSFATHPICKLSFIRQIDTRYVGGGFPSRKLFVARFTDHRFSLWHAILVDPSPRCPSSFQILLLNAIRNQCDLRSGRISWRKRERQREREEGLAHMQMEVYRARARERNRVTARLGDLRIWRHARSVGILVAAWPESRWDETNETMEEESVDPVQSKGEVSWCWYSFSCVVVHSYFIKRSEIIN